MEPKSILKAYLSLNPEYGRILYKSDQRNNLRNPIYLLHNGYVDNTPLMQILAKDIMFCGYTLQEISSDNYLVSDSIDYDKLNHILLYEYGLRVDTSLYFTCHRLFRLMRYVEKHTSEKFREAVFAREQVEKQFRQELLQMFTDCCNGRPPRLDSNPAFTEIDFGKFTAVLYNRYHIHLSQFERRQLNTVESILSHIIFRLRNGGRIYPRFSSSHKKI